MPDSSTIVVDNVSLTLTNLNKVFYPKYNFTKQHVIDYYIRIAPALLSHLTNRPLTLKRYPDGALGKHFYQKECPKFHPKWLLTTPVWSESNKKTINFCVVNNLASLIWVSNLAALELHTSLSLTRNIDCPTAIVFDLDPGYPANIIDCARVALDLKRILDHLNLKSYPKTSGSKGLQVYIPLNSNISYQQTKPFAKVIAQLLESKYPDRVVSNMKKKLRVGKVLIDWSQNDKHKTTVCVYSLRARDFPAVSTPVTWEEVENCVSNNSELILSFNCRQVLERYDKYGDLFLPVQTVSQSLPAI